MRKRLIELSKTDRLLRPARIAVLKALVIHMNSPWLSLASMRALLVRFLPLTLLLCGSVHAESGCPPGEMPNNVSAPLGSAESMNSCAPIPVDAPARPRWQSRWGAVADDSRGIYGLSANEKSERQARKSALVNCKERGGLGCAIAMTYMNQCLSIATSDIKSKAARAPDIGAAEQDSLAGCKESSGGKECSIYYSGCSLPVRVR